VIASQDFSNLQVAGLNLEAFLNDIRREFELAETNEVSCNEGKNFIISLVILNF
jgi:hypothetical protein